jgi:hypothetical protein
MVLSPDLDFSCASAALELALATTMAHARGGVVHVIRAGAVLPATLVRVVILRQGFAMFIALQQPLAQAMALANPTVCVLVQVLGLEPVATPAQHTTSGPLVMCIAIQQPLATVVLLGVVLPERVSVEPDGLEPLAPPVQPIIIRRVLARHFAILPRLAATMAHARLRDPVLVLRDGLVQAVPDAQLVITLLERATFCVRP